MRSLKLIYISMQELQESESSSPSSSPHPHLLFPHLFVYLLLSHILTLIFPVSLQQKVRRRELTAR